MAPVCAACLQPITEPDKFVIARTEVLHRECALQGRTTEVQRLCARLVAQDAAAAEASRSVNRITAAYAKTKALYERRHEGALARCQQEIDQRVAAERARDAAQAQVADLTKRLATQTQDQAPTSSNSSTPERDGTEVRFSLLELD